MGFKVIGLESAPFQHLFELNDVQLREHQAVRLMADGPGMPCRVGLRDADSGEEMLLLNYEHQGANSPYRSSHAIFVARGSKSATVEVNQVPDMLLTRLISVRAFDQDGFMLDAEVCEGSSAAALFCSMLDRAEVSYLHVHTARRGCYLAQIQRSNDTAS